MNTQLPLFYDPRIHYQIGHEPEPMELRQLFISMPWCHGILLPNGRWITRTEIMLQPIKK